MEQIPKRRRRNTIHSKEEKKSGDKSNASSEIMRLEMKKRTYSEQEKVLNKIRRVVLEQLVRVEVEGLQLAANIREKELEQLVVPFDEANSHEKEDHIEHVVDTTNLDDAQEINKFELDLDTELRAILYNDCCPAAEEEDDDEDELKFQYLQEFKSGDLLLKSGELEGS
ncbi:uncharacterized protein LOC124165816 [Ischnura elegans]|uniref:uncharacterized protein LOC124165816 n=1 Tax=Ischnura elegans TaxID=197161 RepID=UPI001ED8733C|nr:uncharacterized protein LOC124165816 [Ischnura elegans]